MSLLSKTAIVFILSVIIIILGAIGLVYMLADWESAKENCADEYGGRIVAGYCTYVEDGTSKSFSIREKG